MEYWYARELGPMLGYSTWQKFVSVIDRAKESCRNSGQSEKLKAINSTFHTTGRAVPASARFLMDIR